MSETSFVLGPSNADWDMLERDLRLDPITFEIVRHKLEAINEEQGIALKAVSSSPVVTEASDFGNGLYLPSGELVAMGPEIVFMSGSLPTVIRNVIADCSQNPGIGEGDMFVVNDPYKGAMHPPDLCLVAPIHHEGDLIAWAGVAAHQVDVGGMVVGSLCAKAREKQQEGLMMPPTKLIEGGVLREDVWRLILNMTRQPQMVSLDLKGFIAANVIARRRLLELIGQYGVDTVTLVMRELLRYSERRFRERLLELPDGEFRSHGFLDHDGHENRVYRTSIKLVKAGDTLTFDFSESSPQAPGFINCTEAGLIGGVFGGVAPLLVRDIPWNHGILNAIEIVAPPGLICNATAPAPTSSATIAEAWMIVNTVVHVVSKLAALSDAHRAHSQAVTNGAFHSLHLGERNQHGEPWGTHLMEAQMGGGGASFTSDGIDQSGGFPSIRPKIPNVETNEIHGPLLYLYRSYFPDSGGDGAQRGGRAAGIAVTPYDVERLRCVFITQGIESPVSLGLFGGYPGATNRHSIVRSSRVFDLLERGELTLGRDSPFERLDRRQLAGSEERPPAKTEEFQAVPGDVLEYRWAGGGGYGDPLRREPAAVEHDLAQAIVSVERASRTYGVVAGDEQATARLRQQIRQERLAEAEPPKALGGGQPGEPVARLGEALLITAGADGLQIECDCVHVLAPASENWKLGCARRSLDLDGLPLVIHTDLELVEYICPHCATLHAVEVEERGAGPLHDIKLGASGFVRQVSASRWWHDESSDIQSPHVA